MMIFGRITSSDSGLLLRTEWRGQSVCLSVGHVREPFKNGWTDWNAVWGCDSGRPKEACIRWGSKSDESICRKGWQDGDVVFHQNSSQLVPGCISASWVVVRCFDYVRSVTEWGICPIKKPLPFIRKGFVLEYLENERKLTGNYLSRAQWESGW